MTNTTLLIIGGIALAVLILLIILVVYIGKRRGEAKKVSFEPKDDEPKELTREEKSGNYQAQGGFNFAAGGTSAAAAASTAGSKDKEAQLRDGQDLSDSTGRTSDKTDATAAAQRQLDERDETPVSESETPSTPLDDEDSARDFSRALDEDLQTYEGILPGAGDIPTRISDVSDTPAESEQPEDTGETENKDNKSDSSAGTRAGITGAVGAAAAAAGGAMSAGSDRYGAEAETPEAPENAQDDETPAEPAAPVNEAEAQDVEAETSEAPEDLEATEAAIAAESQIDAAAQAREETQSPDTTEGTGDSEVVPAEEEPKQETAAVEEIAPAEGRLNRLRGRLSRSQNAIGQGVLGILSAGDLDDDAWEEIEDTLIMADLGVPVTTRVVDSLRERIAANGVSSEAEARGMLREALIEACHPELDRSIKAMPYDGKPAVILVVGVNGTGKTTTTGKLARVLISMGHKVLFGAADTFRAAAADQLETWGKRVGATTVRGKEGADPASVAFDAVARGVEEHTDVVVVDTAGRLHTSVGLMDQLGKVKRVVEKKAAVDEVLLVVDATVGQNGLAQARVFREVVDITGVVLTKLDGTAKGGIVFQVQEELGVPVKLVGLGEGADDLAPFEVESFVDALLGS